MDVLVTDPCLICPKVLQPARFPKHVFFPFLQLLTCVYYAVSVFGIIFKQMGDSRSLGIWDLLDQKLNACELSPFVGSYIPTIFPFAFLTWKRKIFFLNILHFCLGENNLKRLKFTTLLTFSYNIGCPKIKEINKEFHTVVLPCRVCVRDYSVSLPV